MDLERERIDDHAVFTSVKDKSFRLYADLDVDQAWCNIFVHAFGSPICGFIYGASQDKLGFNWV